MLGSTTKLNPFLDILIVKMSLLTWKSYTSELLKLQKYEGDRSCLNDYERELVYSTNSSYSSSGSLSNSSEGSQGSKGKQNDDDSDSDSDSDSKSDLSES